MAFFVKRPDVGDSTAMFTTGLETTLLLVGLGNIGDEYAGTRHNIGFDIIDHFADKQDFPGWVTNKDRKCAESSHTLGTARIILCKPTTLMNNSGEAVQAMQHFYKIANQDTFVVYDEADIDFGQIRLRKGGGAAGHNGVKSLIQHIGEDFNRMRIGVGPKKPKQMDLSDFVLAKFSKKDLSNMKLLMQESNAVLTEYCYGNGQFLEETRNFII